ncbi:RagB/SusD family nutrient uptake outer membrane protein [Dyadobacter fermentans]|uniref:RagB/SusD family nutrient uptake outer membrane protein n=1 Tax=Dyadobacter fermentans TaxID=94254 RepID=UPI001CBB8C56|nr:RagB/SusD family nutrient uptake outer membrane protein [Dyadobacter fermentans]MBZ1361486.1 RagB/SusD family nutrient uptake outer membrane protein [Dyadobacter fermentans]
MKPLKQYIGTALLLTIAASGCNNDLTEKIYSEVTEDTYNYSNAYQAMSIGYANMRSLISHTHWYMAQESTADGIVMPANASGWDDGGIYKRMHLHTWNSENPQVSNMWNTFYSGVINANRLIDQLSNDKITIPTGVTKEALISEMRAVRAFFYWLICDNFGDAPLITDRSDALLEKTSRKDIYQFIVKELTESIPNLSEDKNTLLYARFNKWAAKTLLANVYLNAGVYAGETKWEECLAQCNDVIASGKYQLETGLAAPFVTENQNSPEIVFAIPFEENLAGGFSAHMFSWHASLKNKVNMLATPWGAGSAKGVPQFINTYDADDQRLKSTWMIGAQFAADGVTPLKGSYDQAGKNVVLTNELPDGLYTGEAEGYRMNKFEVKMQAQGSLGNDFPVFRYAQVLMMKAECLLRTGKANDAATVVSQVRARAFAAKPAKATVTGADLQKGSGYQYGFVENYKVVDPGDAKPVQYGRMLDELGWEFAWEGFRRRDMIRFGIYTTKSWLSHKPNGAFRAVFPIPQIAINSNPKLKQNPDYN